ncbi:Uncharacterized protein OBRU01_19096 [Operophtera brumata]|uniref:Gustatory receptor n=1 Tax=Operophtera brumata TaxID=104452 RepID=A0A0L7KXP8_OPEBR|nr:Uncharacterized protein OBRU01_19096 [Operophtera brumata]
MSSPSVRVNTFVEENDEIYVDPISKIFIISEAAFGFFRLPLIRNRKLFYYVLAVFYTVSLYAVFIYFTYVYLQGHPVSFMMVVHMSQYVFCSVFGFICIKRMERYYSTLNRFDKDVGCRPKVVQHSLQNLAQTILTVIMYFVLFIVPTELGIAKNTPHHFLVLHISYTIEIDFYGHLLNLLVPRLKLINYYIQSSLSNVKSEPSTLMNEFVSIKGSIASADMSNTRMRKLMDLYHIMLLVIIISAFLSILGFLYLFSLNVIQGGEDILEGFLLQLMVSVLLMVPLFAPCTFGDKVHHQVKRLRELLASRLYENKLDRDQSGVCTSTIVIVEDEKVCVVWSHEHGSWFIKVGQAWLVLANPGGKRER